MFLICMQLGLLTPPFGLLLFTMKSVAPPAIAMGEVYRAATPYVVLGLLMLGAVMVFPPLATWLPAVLFGKVSDAIRRRAGFTGEESRARRVKARRARVATSGERYIRAGSRAGTATTGTSSSTPCWSAWASTASMVFTSWRAASTLSSTATRGAGAHGLVDEVDVERVLQRQVVRVVVGDVGLADLEPLRAALAALPRSSPGGRSSCTWSSPAQASRGSARRTRRPSSSRPRACSCR